MKRRHGRRMKAEMNVVPYIDVMLVLVVIFMIAAPLIQQSVEVDLPKTGDVAPAVSESDETDLTLPLVLTVDKTGQLFLNVASLPTQALNREEVVFESRQYLQEHPQIDVYVRGDAAVNYERVMAGLQLLKEAGAEKVNLSIEAREESAGVEHD
ncbi:ExbD/TolR family protein [Dichelobacter nodosus]|uniref:TolR protein n=1 Tax=Dichelobacter nodosus (strain VCS1703A) TaxID=246195 RepID=A5EXH4_DICNV|nr:ExbD/TolR family protein [Dichelobacter nodosus]ABQ14341.1 TolR protein [Dichelobacter nodosus VCS1703A]AXM45947.1 ExbD/TolR family protein [Dichelobacter nodosus]KNZ39109.1 hypothetical protein AKG33_04980 [Dichelobacter nodosus]TGA64600.1 ExbD/TolR family protein [Dichelobacter nodosus]